MDTPQTPAARIKAARQARNMTQAELAILAQVDTRSVRRLEDGVRVSVNTLASVCAALKLNAAELTPGPLPAETEGATPASLTQAHAALCQGILEERARDTYGQDNEARAFTLVLSGIVLSIFNVVGCGILTKTYLVHPLANKTDDPLPLLAGMLLLVSLMISIITSMEIINIVGCPFSTRPKVARVRKMIWLTCPLVMPAAWCLACFIGMGFAASFACLLTGAFAPVAIKTYIEFRILQEGKRESVASQEILEGLLDRPLDSEGAILELAANAREAMQARTYPMPAAMLAPLVWLGQDMQLGIATMASSPLYTGLAGEFAQDVTESRRYKDIVEARKTPMSLLYPVRDRFKTLKKKAQEHLQQQYA